MGQALAFLAVIGTVIAGIAAWITHVVACIQAGAWVLLVIGIFVPPIGWIHGVMVWFDMSWEA